MGIKEFFSHRHICENKQRACDCKSFLIAQHFLQQLVVIYRLDLPHQILFQLQLGLLNYLVPKLPELQEYYFVAKAQK